MSIGNDYDTWHADANSLVTLARGFYKWTSFQAPDEIEILEELMNTVVSPREPEPDYDYDDWYDRPGAEYWTIERMFEDL